MADQEIRDEWKTSMSASITGSQIAAGAIFSTFVPMTVHLRDGMGWLLWVTPQVRLINARLILGLDPDEANGVMIAYRLGEDDPIDLLFVARYEDISHLS
jgi:hypothetical protein